MVLYMNKNPANGVICKRVLNYFGNSLFYVGAVGTTRIFAVFFSLLVLRCWRS